MLKSDWKRTLGWFTPRAGLHWTNDMNDFSRIGALLAQRREGHCLPQGLYNDLDAFAFDQEAIFGTSWLMAGFECELPRPGSYVSQMFGKWPVLIVRGKDGEIRAFHNSCRHRGSMICAPGSGSSPKLVCPYHRWTYELDGSLLSAMRRNNVRVIFTEPQFNARLARRLAEDLKITIAELDVLETGRPSRTFYADGMRRNLKSLEAALR